MHELIKQLLGFARGMWRYRWPGVFVAWLVAIVGVAAVFRIPDQYEASARIYVDTQSILKPLMAGLTVQPNVAQQINMLSRTLLSRPNLERLVRMADLDLGAKTPQAQDALIVGLGKAIEIREGGRDNLYTLAIKDSDQDKARRIVQSLTSIFVESSLGASRRDSDSAKTFLDEQIRRFEAKLEESEGRLKEFRLRNLEIQAVEGRDVATAVREAMAQVQSAKLELREAENARDAVKQQLEAERSQPGGGAPSSLLSESAGMFATPELDARIEALKRNLDGLLQRYTDQHPDVVISRRQLRELEEQRTREVAEQRKAAEEAAAGAGPAAAATSPAIQALQQMLAASEVQVATLRTRVGEFENRLVRARESLKTAPALEAEAAQLNRDHAINKKNYEDLVSRRQTAVMSGELEGSSGVAEFRLIDPPRVSPRPVSPNRIALLPLALLAGVVAGLGISLLISQLRPAFYDPSELRAKTGVPLLGVVSMRIDDATKRRERGSLLRFAGATGGLFAVFGIGLAMLVAMG
jgi:polysaccharide chain length determinant protein (PEP-CTERM system associated)